jgi:tRNA-dihydrouridine synthase
VPTCSLYVAPLEGLTGRDFRQVHHRLYPGATRYYTPFLSPIDPPGLTPKAMREIAPENNEGYVLIPQLLTNRADHFLAAAETLASLGYTEVNLNLGCPSGTVVSKGKASGMLCDPDAVDRLLDAIFTSCPIKISIKTRIGRYSTDELPPIMEVYNRYPIAELTVHPRIRTQMYRGKPDMEAFSYIVSHAKMPLCYNGDLFSADDLKAVAERFPTVSAFMIGRGLMTNPGLIGEIQGHPRTELSTLRTYYNELFSRAAAVLSGETHLLHHMKELWFYLAQIFEESEKWTKGIRKCKRLAEYQAIVDDLFARGRIGETTSFSPPAES